MKARRATGRGLGPIGPLRPVMETIACRQSPCYSALGTFGVKNVLVKFAACFIIGWPGAAAGQDSCLGPVALAARGDGRMVYVGCYDGRRVLVVDLERRAVVRSMRTPGAVTSLAFSPQEKLLCATCWAEDRSVTSRGPEPFRSDCVVLIDTAQWRRAAVLPAGHGPLAAVVSPDGGRLYVCSRFDDEVLVIDLRQRRLLHRMAAGREPVAAALTPDGRRLVVADHLPADPADRFYTTATVQIIDTRTWQKATVRLPDGSTGVRGVCVDPQGRYAFVTHILANYQLVPAQVVGGWTNTNVLSIVDVQQARFVNSVQLDELDRSARHAGRTLAAIRRPGGGRRPTQSFHPGRASPARGTPRQRPQGAGRLWKQGRGRRLLQRPAGTGRP